MPGKLIYVTYAAGAYVRNLGPNGWFARHFMRADQIMQFTRADLEAHPLYAAHREIFDVPRGAGYWAWKPLFITEALKQAGPNDVVIYHDCGMGLRYKTILHPTRLIALARSSGFLAGVHNGQHGSNRRWNRRACLELMGADSDRVRDAVPVEAAVSLWTTNELSRRFLDAWLSWCLNLEAIRDDTPQEHRGEDPAFVEHRHDQSILTNLAVLEQAPVITPRADMLRFAKSVTMLELDQRGRDSLFWRLCRDGLLGLLKLRLKVLGRP